MICKKTKTGHPSSEAGGKAVAAHSGPSEDPRQPRAGAPQAPGQMARAYCSSLVMVLLWQIKLNQKVSALQEGGRGGYSRRGPGMLSSGDVMSVPSDAKARLWLHK